MTPQNKKILIIVLIVFVSCLLVALIAGLAGFIYFLPRLRETFSAAPTQEAVSAPASPTPADAPSSQPADSLDPAIAAQMDAIEEQVSAIRGIPAESDVPRRLLSEQELEQIVRDDFFADYSPEDAAKDAQVLALLGLLPRDFDLLSFYTDLYSEQISGYYDDEAKAMFVVKGEQFSCVERDTYAHEFTHALQDQKFDFNGALNYTDEACEEDSERCAALQSLIEGDATLTELNWFQSHASQQDLKDIQNFYNSYESPVYDSAPVYMQSDFLFAYNQGYEFVQALFAADGYAAIDRAFTTEQPLSTEQILHPSRYPDDKPLPVDLRDMAKTLGSDWEETERNVMGEWYTWLILSKGENAAFRLQEDLASAAAEGWGGDTYTVLANSQTGEAALLVRYVWDSTSDANEAFAAFEDYVNLRFGEARADGLRSAHGYHSALARHSDSGFTWIITETVQTLATLLSGLGEY